MIFNVLYDEVTIQG